MNQIFPHTFYLEYLETIIPIVGTGSNRLTEPRLFILNGTQSNRITPSRTGYHPIGLGPGQNEQPRLSESIGTSSTR